MMRLTLCCRHSKLPTLSGYGLHVRTGVISGGTMVRLPRLSATRVQNVNGSRTNNAGTSRTNDANSSHTNNAGTSHTDDASTSRTNNISGSHIGYAVIWNIGLVGYCIICGIASMTIYNKMHALIQSQINIKKQKYAISNSLQYPDQKLSLQQQPTTAPTKLPDIRNYDIYFNMIATIILFILTYILNRSQR